MDSHREVIILFLLVAVPVGVLLWEENPHSSIVPDSSITSHDFSEIRARVILEKMTKSIGIRRAGEHSNEVKAVNYILGVLKGIKDKASPSMKVEFEEQRGDGSFTWTKYNRGLFYKQPVSKFASGHYHNYQNLSNVVIKISPNLAKNDSENGVEDDPLSVLFGAHYDTGKTSPGGSDDTIHVAALLELARALSQTTEEGAALWRRNVIILLNGAEEVGLLGSHLFMDSHRWASEVGCWINLESHGAGGRLLYLRTIGRGSGWLTQLYGSVSGFGSSILNEIFSQGWFSSNTDGEVFGKLFGVPGIDLLLYQNGYVYHSPLDDLDAIPEGTLQDVGNIVLQMARRITAMSWLPNHAEPIGLFPMLGAMRMSTSSLFLNFVSWTCIVGIGTALAVNDKLRLNILLACLSGWVSCAFAVLTACIVAFIVSSVSGPIAGWFSKGPLFATVLFGVPSMFVRNVVADLIYKSVKGTKYYRKRIASDLEEKHRYRYEYDYVAVGILASILSLYFDQFAFSLASLIAVQVTGVVACHFSKAAASFITTPLSIYITGQSYLQLARNLIPVLGRAGSQVPSDYILAIFVSVLVMITLATFYSAFGYYIRRHKNMKQFFAMLSIALIVSAMLGAPFTPQIQQRLYLQHSIEIHMPTVPMCDSQLHEVDVGQAESFLMLKSLGGSMDRLVPHLPHSDEWYMNDTFPGLVRHTPASSLGSELNMHRLSQSLCVVSNDVVVKGNGKRESRVLKLRGVHPHTPHSMLYLSADSKIEWQMEKIMRKNNVDADSIAEMAIDVEADTTDGGHKCRDGRCSIEFVSNDKNGWELTIRARSGVPIDIQYGIVDYKTQSVEIQSVLDTFDDTVSLMLSPRTVSILSTTIQ